MLIKIFKKAKKKTHTQTGKKNTKNKYNLEKQIFHIPVLLHPDIEKKTKQV